MTDSTELTGPNKRWPVAAAERLELRASVQAWYRLALFIGLGLAFALVLQAGLAQGLRRYDEGNVGIMNRVMAGGTDVDLLISGSSRAMYHYDPRIIEAETGLRSFNIGRNGTKLHEQLHLLRLYVARNKRPAYLVQNVDITSLRENDDVTDPKQYIAWLHDDDVYRPLVEQKRYYRAYKWLPLVGLTRTGGMEAAIMGWLRGRPSRLDEFKGYSPQHLTWNEDFEKLRAANPEGLTWTIDSRKLRTLEDLLELCKRNSIHVVLVSSPDYVETQRFFRARRETLDAFQRVAGRFGVPFWDYSSDAICQNRDYFYNSQHLNDTGATAFSKSIALRLSAFRAAGR